MSTGQIPDKPGVDIAKKQLAVLGLFPGLRDLVQNPFDFRPGKIGGQGQSGFAPQTVLAPLFGQLLADKVGAGILPDKGIIDRSAGGLLPDHRGLALIGHPDGRYIGGGGPGFSQDFPNHFPGVVPYFQGIVFHPARFRKNLPVFFLRQVDNTTPVIEKDKPVAGRSQVYGTDEFRHGSSFFIEGSRSRVQGLRKTVNLIPYTENPF